MTMLEPPRRRAHPAPADHTPEGFDAYSRGHLPGLLGLEMVSVDPTRLVARVPVTSAVMAPHGLVHGGALVTVADSVCGYGTIVNLPDDARGFVTVELKTNFLGAAAAGAVLRCEATPLHLGRTTQIWDATIDDEDSGRALVVFRCTQMVLH
jgi:1,4-dihydroxy-2-naphthoyl-CoA hydrolase